MPGRVVCFSGRMTSGKSSVSSILAQVLHRPRVGFSDYLRARLTANGIEPTREALQDLGRQLVSVEPDAFCQAVLDLVGFEPGSDLLLDGLRHTDIYDRVRRLVAPSSTILIHLGVDDATVQARADNRAEDGAALLRADGHPRRS